MLKALFICLGVFLFSCSDKENEDRLVDLHTVANQDVIAIGFPAEMETTVSINSFVQIEILGLKSNGVDEAVITSDVEWSLSSGALSSIDRSGILTTADNAESITVIARFGYLTESIDIWVSAAVFDQVVALHSDTLIIDMCQSQVLAPVGRYEDDEGGEEIRTVDSTNLALLTWDIFDQEDDELSKRAYIAKVNNQLMLHSLSAGEVNVRATHKETDVVSADLAQTIGSALASIKLCSADSTDLSSCDASSGFSVEQDEVLSLISVGNYLLTDGSDAYQNITRNSQWGLDSDLGDESATVFSTDRQQLEFTSNTDDSTADISVACGLIDQSIEDEDISEGVNLEIPVSCDLNDNCLIDTADITVNPLTVLSFDVTANGVNLTHTETTLFDSRPEEITLNVKANYSNVTTVDVTDEDIYTIIDPVDGLDVIEEKEGTSGVFTVLNAGIAKIEINLLGKSFLAVIEVP